MKKWWEKIKEHQIYSKVAAGLILAGLLAILNQIFSWNIFSSMFSAAIQEWIVPTWLFIVIMAILIIISWIAHMFFWRKAKVITDNNQMYPERVRVVREFTKPHQYIIKNNTVRHIPDPETFEYLGQLHGFDWGGSEGIAPDDFKHFSLGSALPSIRPYCQAFYEKKIKPEMVWDSPYYWKLKGGEKDGPYCQCCYDKDNTLIRLQRYETGVWNCMVCKTAYTDKNYRSSGAFTVEDF